MSVGGGRVETMTCRIRKSDRRRTRDWAACAFLEGRPAAAVVRAALLLAVACAPGQAPAAGDPTSADDTAIRQLIAEHYVSAVFRTRDEASVRRGFHPGFQLFVLDDGELIMAPLQMWLDRLELDGVVSASDVRHDVIFIDVTGDAAVLRTELFVDGEHEYTDYFSLYRFPADGWRIVTKIFQAH